MNEIVNKIYQYFIQSKKAYISCNGLHQDLNLHVIHACTLLNDTLYFGLGKCERAYGEISQDNQIVMIIDDGINLIKLKGVAVFVNQVAINHQSYQDSLYLQKQFPDDPNMIISFFFSSAMVEEYYQYDIEPSNQFILNNLNSLTGIKMVKDNEIKERLLKLLEQRVLKDISFDQEEQKERLKIEDGRLLYFLETAKEIWKRMNILPIETVLIYETYDEREKYVNMAKEQIGNVTIKQVEDLTYYLTLKYFHYTSGCKLKC